MRINKMIRSIRELGVSIWVENGKIHYFKKDGKLEDDIKSKLVDNKTEIVKYFEEDGERFDSFPLTDIQMAYLLGRRGAFEYGDVASHLYMELDYPSLDCMKVQDIWNRLIAEHDMLRAVISENGTQKVLKNVEKYHIYISAESEEIRNKWANKYFKTEMWPMFDIGVTNSSEKSTLHLSFDFLIADWASIWTLLMEFETIYFGKKDANKKCTVTFRNYILNEIGMKNSRRYGEDKEYWEKRLDTIPEAPILPLQSNTIKTNRFVRFAKKIQVGEWEKIKEFSMRVGVTSTATVLSIFALCIERWSSNKRFALNLTTLIRNDKYSNIYNTIGDFTSVNLLEFDLSKEVIFRDFIKTVNKQIFEDLDHNAYSGVEVIRDLRKKRRNPKLFYPIIFTSSIGLLKLNDMIGKINDNGISQTPQAFLDCQVMDSSDGLYINWDVREGIFEKDVVQDIFYTFIKYLKAFSGTYDLWDKKVIIELPENQICRRKTVNNTFRKIEADTLQNLFVKSASHMPEKIAIVDEDGEYTYEELLWVANGIAKELKENGCKRGDFVGIKLDKGFFQIASVLGVLFTGAAFVPIDNEQPELRAKKIINTAKISFVISENENFLKENEDCKVIRKNQIYMQKQCMELVLDNVSDVAYIIFTSGSTGEPKGVVIEQQAVLNTIVDINDRLNVKDNDCVLALSQLHFDLSIYDIFGMLAVGGKIIIPGKDRYKDPSYWLMLVEKWKITIWNSVPAFMNIFVEYLEHFACKHILSIDKVLLSGDWIPTYLPEKIRMYAKKAEIYSLGGATEASIWSIYHNCKVDEHYTRSIPYGFPLCNQGFRVLDSNKRDCPDMVEGELYITGKGLAKEYLGDVEKTMNSFVSLFNERIYRTGDFGRYLGNGEIEFLGRKDSQVKILGHRIEIGEIENVLMECKNVKMCCVTTIELHNDIKVVAIVIPEEDADVSEGIILDEMKQRLPKYMLPFAIEITNKIPCTNNGKIDRNAIQGLFSNARVRKVQGDIWQMENDLEKKVYMILVKALKVDRLSPNDNLFELGADSLIMAQIAGNVKETIGLEQITFDELLRQILNNPTGGELVKYINTKHSVPESKATMLENVRFAEKSHQNTLFVFFHAALGTTNCYRFIEHELKKIDSYDLLFINIDNVDEYCSISCDVLVDVISDRYMEQIERLNYEHINLVGYCLGGIIALNVAVKLLEKGLEVNGLFILDSYPVSGKIEDDFIDEVIFLPNYQIKLSEIIEGIDDFQLMEEINCRRKCNNGNIPKGTFDDILKKSSSLLECENLKKFAGKSREERFIAYTSVIEKKFHVGLNTKMLESAFAIYRHSFRGAYVELPFYSGNICYMAAIENQAYLFVDKEKNLESWNNICLGEFELIEIQGNHVTCILDEKNALKISEYLIGRNKE